MPGRATVRPEKSTRVESLRQRMLGSPMTALVGLRGVPASALQRMRRELRQRGHPMEVAQNSALRHALEAASTERPALKSLLDHLKDQTALLTTEGNPFALYQELFRTRSPTPARGGEISPRDIVVPGGATSFKPGPIVGELQHAGFPAAIEKGKVVLKKETTIVRAGQPIPREVAALLTRLDIFPLEVGLELRAVVEGSTFYAPSVLAVDLDAYRADLARAHRQALGLALEIGYVTPLTLPLLITRAHRQAIAVAVAVGYPTPKTIGSLLARALTEALAVQRLQGAS
ncbi:MAG TPA: 50S ribosomal protein L10 [Thermoplasmata archaeon]|nr:50S ribosomal protein L10 [Thermoplasmata archaeon]